ncbi:MAG: Caudovirus prohead protease [Firmicutes bacterium ADurb.Bin506]|nr:MAG: Caudovirus prohead protease [Firmicutes bacterium ADurb.Bin506]
MEFTPQQATEAAQSIGIDLDREKIPPEDLAAGMTAEAARHGTKDATTDIVADDPVIAAKLALANLRVSPNYYSPKTGKPAWEKSLARGAKKQGVKTEYKTLLFNVDDYDEEQGIFSGYAAIVGNLDDGGDIIEAGAFTKTIAEGWERVKILALHNDCWLPIGRPLELREDAKGLYIKAKVSDTTTGRDVKVLLKDGVLCELSIGYDPIVFDYDEHGIRHLREVKLWEVSVVTWAMNPEATITGYKAAEAADRAAKIVTDAASDIKEGRKISSARLKTLKDARETMKKAAKTLDALISEVEGEKAADRKPQTRQPAASRAQKQVQTPTIEITFD